MKNFNIEQHSVQSLKVLELEGELDAHTAPRLEEKLKKLIEQNQIYIVVNFSRLNYIASAGLGVFMAYIEDFREHGGDIKLTDMSDKVYNVFDLLGFPALYDILETQDEAVKKFEAETGKK